MDNRPEFQVHMLNEAGKDKANRLAQHFSATLDAVEAISGNLGREMALVRTHMELACFYAKKAMASRPENQQ